MGSSSSKHCPYRSGSIDPPPRSMSIQNHRDRMERGESRCASFDKALSRVMLRPVEEGGENEEPSAVEVGLEDVFSRDGATSPSILRDRLFEKAQSVQQVHAIETNPEGYLRGNHDDGRDLETGSSNWPCRRFASEEIMQGYSGLRLLLSPMATPERVFTRSIRGDAVISKPLSACGTSVHKTCYEVTGLATAEVVATQPEWIVGDADLEEPGSPLFDPSILATFERALEITADDSWLSSDLSNTSPRNLFSSPELFSDAESPEWPRPSEPQDNLVGCLNSQSMGEEMRCKQVADSIQNKACSNGDASECFYKEWTKIDYLEHFEFKSPPGCEGKTVLYFTSMRGIRKTFEDCCNVRMILKGFGVQVDERDVWMHSKFRQELTNIMGDALSVPRLFIKGRYIGGAEEVKHFNEDGVLAKLLEGLPTEWNDNCDLCGGVRFIPCNTCGGSCKTVSSEEVIARCLDCNENGLSMCPSCGWQ